MLQPVMTVPSAVSSAAPTLKCEKAASACSRARRAAADEIDLAGRIAQRGAARAADRGLRRSPSARPTSLTRRSKPVRRSASMLRAPIVEQQAHARRPAHAVDDVGDARDLVQAARSAPAPRDRAWHRSAAVGVGPVAHGVEAQRLRFVADHLGAPVLLADQQRLELRRRARGTPPRVPARRRRATTDRRRAVRAVQ